MKEIPRITKKIKKLQNVEKNQENVKNDKIPGKIQKFQRTMKDFLDLFLVEENQKHCNTLKKTYIFEEKYSKRIF